MVFCLEQKNWTKTVAPCDATTNARLQENGSWKFELIARPQDVWRSWHIACQLPCGRRFESGMLHCQKSCFFVRFSAEICTEFSSGRIFTAAASVSADSPLLSDRGASDDSKLSRI